jgi:hypothetical protein
VRLHIISLLKVLFLETSFRSSGVARVVFIFEFNLCGVVCCDVSYVVMMFFFLFLYRVCVHLSYEEIGNYPSSIVSS